MNNIIKKVSELHGVSPEEVKAEMQLAINLAWNDPAAQKVQQVLFQDRKPSPEQFIKTIAECVVH